MCSTATNTFASLVKMVLLEAGLPDPPDFPKTCSRSVMKRDNFLTQLLDGSKVEQYTIPTKINAELHPYQQDGINWLAFLAKYHQHGILCDDMGLGKTLQSKCMLARKRARRPQSPDAVPLALLIVCPPTLTGPWYYEIFKYADNLKPMLYTGHAHERQRLLSKVSSCDVHHSL
ncbi:hypothetical protein BDZ89DRAFT_1148438 [Hymenopellis radicata]|nr:hypothetical protein BDZ89DRAFT_1148438 [Hymenopellis radicata]